MLASVLGTALEEPGVEAVYARLNAGDFSAEVLAKVPLNLTVVPVHGVDWSDLGELDCDVPQTRPYWLLCGMALIDRPTETKNTASAGNTNRRKRQNGIA